MKTKVPPPTLNPHDVQQAQDAHTIRSILGIYGIYPSTPVDAKPNPDSYAEHQFQAQLMVAAAKVGDVNDLVALIRLAELFAERPMDPGWWRWYRRFQRDDSMVRLKAARLCRKHPPAA